MPQRDLRGVVALADAPDDAAARRRAHSRPVRRVGVSFQGRSARFESRAARASCASRRRSAGTHVYRVTKVIGGRYREDFAGVEVADEGSASAAAVAAPKAELILPVSFVFQPPSFRSRAIR